MRKLLLFLAFILSVCIIKAQAPLQLNFQGVARDLQGNALVNQAITLRLSIQTAASGGVTEYSETRSITTNVVGLFSVVIGSTGATTSSGNMANINWNIGSRFLLLEMDIQGGNNFVSMGSTQFQSVPYAIYANTSGSATNVSGVVSVNNGGTGSTSLGLNNLLLGNGTNPLQTLAPGASGNVVTSNGTTWTSSSATYWSLAGNANIIEATDFIGTTDPKPLSFKVNNTWSGQIHPSNGNTSYGLNAFNGTSTGTYNTAIGVQALFSNTIGSYNTATGLNALVSNTRGASNTATGASALQNNTEGDVNTAFGGSALYANTTGSYNTANGRNALAFNTLGSYNTASGEAALANNKTGYQNTANGQFALVNNTTGSNNTASGQGALQSNTTGGYNTAIGINALQSNTIGSNNTAIGINADVSANNLSNATAIGNSTVVNASNKVRIGNNSVTAIDVAGQLKVNANSSSNAFTLPAGRGTTGQVLSTDGAGVTSWATAAGGPVSGFTHYLGENFNGGIIYYLYKGSNNLEHGLIVNKTQSTAQWQASGVALNADRTDDGAYNTDIMKNLANITNSPAATYIATLGSGWYLPSIDELNLLYYNRYLVQKGLRAGGSGFTLLTSPDNYWSSTESSTDLNRAYYFGFFNGFGGITTKINTYSVRGVMAF